MLLTYFVFLTFVNVNIHIIIIIITARCYVLVRSLLSPGVCPSVTLMHHQIKKHFLQWYQRGSVHFPRGTSLAGSQNRRALGKICDFRPKSPFRPTGISETVQDRPINLLLWNVNSNSTDRPVPSDRVTRITRVSRSVYLQVKYLKKNGAS